MPRGAEAVDVIVIGGGVNGTGVARDCALRGLRVALFERNDIGFGASGNSSGMIHGGPRYLTKNPHVTYSSCLDSGHIQRIAPHMLFRVPFLVPVLNQGWAGRAELATYDAFFEVYDRYQYLKRGKRHLRYSAEQVHSLEPSLVPTNGAVSFDEWGIDGVRLCISSLKDAEERGARVFNQTTVSGLIRDDDGTVVGVRFIERECAKAGELRAKVVVNASGAWAPIVASLCELPQQAARLRPGKGIHVFLDRRLSNFAIVTQAVDGRQVFLLPWQNMSVLGTTDDDFSGDLDDVVATAEEVRYLRQAIERVVPAVTQARAIGTWGGVRPTLYEWGKLEDVLSRDHRIVDHAQHGADGLISMLGGKLASYRLFAEETVDVVMARLKQQARCQTHELSLPGGEQTLGFDELTNLAQQYELDLLTVQRLYFRHGYRLLSLLEGAKQRGESLDLVCTCDPVTEAEVRHCVRNEWASSVGDVARRTRLGSGPCGGMRCALSCGRIVADERGTSPQEGLDSATRFLRDAFRRRLPTVGPEQAKTEALWNAQLYAETGVEVAK